MTEDRDDEIEAKAGAKKEGADEVDATGADPKEREAKEELFEAIDHFKNAASILFRRASSDPAVKNVSKEAERVVRKVGDAAEPLARQLTDELGRLTRDVMRAVDPPRKRKKKERPSSEEE